MHLQSEHIPLAVNFTSKAQMSVEICISLFLFHLYCVTFAGQIFYEYRITKDFHDFIFCLQNF